MTKKMIVFGVNGATGDPDFWFCKIECTEEQCDGDLHYEYAVDFARNDGDFDGWYGTKGMIPLDEDDDLFKYLDFENKVEWDTAMTYNVMEKN